MNPIGVNILAQYVRNTSALMDFLKRSDPAAVVVMDSPPMAAAIHAQNPKAITIHRAYSSDDNHWQDVTDPQSWLNANAQHGGVVTQCMNEPAPGDLDKFFTWLEGVVRLAPADVVLALPNFAVGNPHENGILAGVYDRILRLVCGTRHFLALHEYFKDDAVLEAPYLCGRFTYWQKRAQSLNLPPPRLVITEHGRDVGGGRNDGWQGAGWSEADYFQRLASAQKSVYEYAVPVTIYCWGTGANNDWLSFDIEDANSLQASIIQFGQEHPLSTPVPPIPPTPPLYPPGINPAPMLVNQPAGVKLRAAPTTSAATIRAMPYAEQVTVYAQPVEAANGYSWQRVTDSLGNNGWSAMVIEGRPSFIPVTEPEPEPPPVTKFTITSPLPNGVITAHFNEPRDYDGDGIKDDKHEGTDWALAPNPCAIGDVKVLAAADGVVESVRTYADVRQLGNYTTGYGVYVKVKHIVGADTFVTWYCHLSAELVCKGQAVKRGDPIGVLGTTGNSTGYHVHLNLQYIGHGLSGYVVQDVVPPEDYLV